MGERGIYTADFAKVMVKDAGHKWRPSNGTEGELFQGNYCANCDKWDADDGCPIAAATFFLNEDDPAYPEEWQIGKDGQPTCTAFPISAENDPRQISFFS